MAKFKEGDTVAVAAREMTPADTKSGLYYAHYAGMRGTILKVYGEEISVLVDFDSMPADVQQRHLVNQDAMRQKWLDGLSEEARGKLTATEKNFRLNYAILVSLNDVTASKGDVKKATAADLEAAEAAFLASRSKN
jgi:ribosomal protein L21E